MESYAEKGNIGKLEAAAEAGKPKELRLAALDAARLVKVRRGVELLMNALRDSDVDIRRAATKSLLMNATKDTTDRLLNYSEQEEDKELAAMMKEAAIAAKERTPRI